MGNVKLYGASSGYVEIVPTAASGTSTLTLPAATGTLATTANVTSAVAAVVPGKILQVVSVTKIDSFTTTSTTYVDVTGLTATITPTSASSKILVLSKVAMNSRGAQICNMQLLRGASVIGGGTAVGSRNSATSGFYAITQGTSDQVTNFLDSPATTAATTYKIQVNINATTLGINTTYDDSNAAYAARSSSTITLMEVSA